MTDDTELDLTVQVPRRVSRRMVLVDREELGRLRARVAELESEVAGLQGGYDDLAARHESLLNQLGATDA